VRLKTILIATALVSSLLGAIMAYLVLTVPNDLKSGALLKQARTEMSQGKNDEARKTLTTLIQQYPRTDAAAAATVALVSLVDSQHSKLGREVEKLRAEQKRSTEALSALGGRVTQIANRPVPAPEPPAVQPPAPKPQSKIVVKKSAPKKTTAKKKTTPKKKTTTRRRR
jgi:hypothetical protein